MGGFIKLENLCINPTTTIDETSGVIRMPFEEIPHFIQTEIDQNLKANLDKQQKHSKPIQTLGHILMEAIIEKQKDIKDPDTFENSTFLGIVLLKTKNIFDTRRFSMACIDFTITPATIATHSVNELVHYAYTIAKNPQLLLDLFPEAKIDLNHDYYPDFIEKHDKLTTQKGK